MSENINKAIWRSFRNIFLFFALLVLYVVTAVPFGLFVYSLKTDLGINLFQKTGFHSFVQCLREEAYKTQIQEKNPPLEDKKNITKPLSK